MADTTQNHDSNQYTISNWQRLSYKDKKQIKTIEEKYGINLNHSRGRAATEESGFVFIPIEMVIKQDKKYLEISILFSLSENLLISVEQNVKLLALDAMQEHLALIQEDTNSSNNSPKWILFHILETLNAASKSTISDIAIHLKNRSDAVLATTGGFDTSGHQAGVADISDTAVSLGEAEELVAKAVEAQLMLARACRWLRRYTDAQDDIRQPISLLLSDIQSLRRYARFQHDKIRNLQQSLMTTLDMKQNQIIKVFTVVTAVFTPPTLIASFYGQNFAYMPELAIGPAEWIVMAMTGVFALIPLIYVKRKGWLR